MKTPFVIIVALEDELDAQSLPPYVPIIYSGIGKVNASIATFAAIQKYDPTMIINFGTVGKINSGLSGLIKINKVVQRDMIAEPLAPRGTVPFSNKPNEYYSELDGYTCGTGDSFVTRKDPWLIDNCVDVVDMELFAIAAVANDQNVKWCSYKFISDEASESSGQEWTKQVNCGQDLFLQELMSGIRESNS